MTAPLAGVTVIDASRALAGPHAAMLLGDLGARVIKVEPPHGDDSRRWGPPFVEVGDERVSTYYLACNRNKESIVLDLKLREGRESFRQLVARSDVLVENFRPGALARLGMSHDLLQALNPRLVILSITGFGHDGPQAHRPGYDQIAQGEAGLMSLTGPDPDHVYKVGVPIGDLLAGINGALGVSAALYERARTGRGRVVRTSLLAAIVSTHSFQGTRWTVAGQRPTAEGNQHPSISPYGAYRCADGDVQIAVGSEGLWRSFADAFGLDADDPRLCDNEARLKHRSYLDRLIRTAFGEQTRAQILTRLAAAGVPAGELRTIDRVYEWEQTASQGLLVNVVHPIYGEVRLPGSALRFDDNPHSSGRTAHLAPPLLGEHTSAITAWLDNGMSTP